MSQNVDSLRDVEIYYLGELGAQIAVAAREHLIYYSYRVNIRTIPDAEEQSHERFRFAPVPTIVLIMSPECLHVPVMKSLDNALGVNERSGSPLIIPFFAPNFDLQLILLPEFSRLQNLQHIRYNVDNPDGSLSELRRYSRRSSRSAIRLAIRRALCCAFLTVPFLPYFFNVASACLFELDTIRTERKRRPELEKRLKELELQIQELQLKSAHSERKG